jgi:hypothetical protein
MRLIDADAKILAQFYDEEHEEWEERELTVADYLSYSDTAIQFVDAVPVVRCKDCEHNYSKKHNKRYNHEDIVCDYFETDGLNDDDFCSYGERSEE